ncbi:C40 family peptidase [Actinomadura rupiterrae]|uniref:C40 family peptidase n=1 Tax=Actinomadura rupiterrae TaxID=559627 RepID=UPI0020A5405E|nr:NlpC/P60 family protein [Actinomadura rupiterrae]MCP2342943.1 cell wall-associated NlpC family hydrolase [Actinomadura rupiterrae]
MPVLIAAGAGLGGLVLVAVLGAFSTTLGMFSLGRPGTAACQSTPGKAASSIPPAYLHLYVQAGTKYAVPWNVLAAVGNAESSHGRAAGPGIHSGTNSMGAAGPMQFLLSTWASFGVDGDGDGRKDVYDPADAIFGAANYLRHNGAPAQMEQALYAYNHDRQYVKGVLAQAAAYSRDAAVSACATLTDSVSGRAGLAIRAALRMLGTPYSWGGGGPSGPSLGTGRGANTIGFDCSSLVQFAWHQAGIDIPRTTTEQWARLSHVPPGQQAPGDLVFFNGADGSAGSPGHVGLVLSPDQMIEAPHTGATVRVSAIGTRTDLVGYARINGTGQRLIDKSPARAGRSTR